MFRRILLAWDGSEGALRAYDVAIDLTRRYLEQTFVEVRDRAERVGVEVQHTIVEAEDPGTTLLDHAHEHGFDLLVCGHHHARRAGRTSLRGVAEALVARASVSVLAVGELD